MEEEDRKERIKNIRNFITVVVGGVLAAFIVSAALLYFYSATGRYLVDQVLLNPEVTTMLSKNDNHSGLVFDGVEYVHYMNPQRGWVREQIGNGEYAKVYQLIQGTKSLHSIPDQLEMRFSTEKPASLVLSVKVENGSSKLQSKQVFQEVQILPDGNFRVELRQGSDRNQWAYFFKQGLYEETEKILYHSQKINS